MRVHQRFAVLLGLVLVTGSLGFAQGVGETLEAEKVVLAATNANPTAMPAPDEPPPAPAAQPQAGVGPSDDSVPPSRLIPTTAGPLGLFTLETADILPKGAWSVAGYVNKFSRMPGSVTVLNLGFNFGVGINDWLNLYLDFEPHRHTHVSQPGQLSLRSPLANPVFPNTFFRTLLPGTTPAYVEDYPFAANNDGGVGELTLGLKFGLLSEGRGQPFSLSLRNDFIIPTRTSLTGLQGNGTQSGEFNDLLSVAVSRNWSDAVTLGVNFGARFAADPNASGTQLLSQANQLRIGAGFILRPQSRVQFMNEYTGVVFVGSSTPNQSFGARDPLDGVWGLRLYPRDDFAVDLGYRHMLNLGNAQDRHGFVIKMGYAHQPAPPPPVNRQPVATCSLNPAVIITGSTEVGECRGRLAAYHSGAVGDQFRGAAVQPSGAGGDRHGGSWHTGERRWRCPLSRIQ